MPRCRRRVHRVAIVLGCALTASPGCYDGDDASSPDGGISVDAVDVTESMDIGRADVSVGVDAEDSPDVGVTIDGPDAGRDVQADDRADASADRPTDAPDPNDPDHNGGVWVPNCTRGGWCWTNPLPGAERLLAVWTGASNDVWLGGYNAALHWNGASWAQARFAADCPTSYSISAFWGSSNDLWAVGSGETSSTFAHFDGTQWSCRLRLASEGGVEGAARAIWGTSAHDIWAVDGGLLHYDGVSWSRMANPVNDTDLGAVWGVSANDWWLGGKWGLHHFDGTTWATKYRTSSNGICIFQITGSRSDDAWAAGSFGSDPNPGGWATRHWNGTEWTIVASTLGRVWTSGPNDVWIPPFHFDGVSSDGGLKESRYFEQGAYCRNGAAGVSPSDVWMVGDTPLRAGAVVCHYDGNDLSIVARDVFPGNDPVKIFDAWGSSPSDLWAVGPRFNIIHWDGQTWSFDGAGASSAVSPKRIHGSSAQDVWIIGNDGTTAGSNALHWDGQAWLATRIDDTANSGMPITLSDIWVAAADDAWMIGYHTEISPIGGRTYYSLLLRWDGTAWTVAQRQEVGSVFGQAIWGSGPNDVWAIGSGIGPLARFDGATWSPVTDWPGKVRPIGIAGTSSSDIWFAAGNDPLDGGRLVHYDGSTWTRFDDAVVTGPITTAAPGELYHACTGCWGPIAPAPTTDRVQKWDGTKWINTDAPGQFVYAVAPGDVWTFYYSEILHHTQ